MPTRSLAELYSGMHIPATPERIKIGEILDLSHEEWCLSFGRTKNVDEANTTAQTLLDIPGITLIQAGDYGEDYHNRCAHYAFGTVNGETWAEPYSEIDSDIWLRPRPFLEAQGYVLRDTPRTGDIGAYSFFEREELESDHADFQHFGIVQADGSLNSKFNQGPVVNHAPELVPTNYGDYLYFLGSVAHRTL